MHWADEVDAQSPPRSDHDTDHEDSDDEQWAYDDDVSSLFAGGSAPGGGGGGGAAKESQGSLSGGKLSTSVVNDIRKGQKKQQGKARHTGKDDRATNEQVLDPRTRMMLYKLLNRGVLDEINGCLSTGKEVRRRAALPAAPSLRSLQGA